MKTRKCEHCGTRKPIDQMIYRSIKSFCDTVCLIDYTRLNNNSKIEVRFENKVGKAERLKLRKKKTKKVKTAKDLKPEAQAVFNKYIRLRDINRGYGCISCEKPFDNNSYGWDAGHYISRRHNFTRYHLDNVHLQCKRCNQFLSGNIVEYRKKLIQRIGEDKVLWIEKNYRTSKKFTLEYLQRFKKIFSKKARIMEKRINEKSF